MLSVEDKITRNCCELPQNRRIPLAVFQHQCQFGIATALELRKTSPSTYKSPKLANFLDQLWAPETGNPIQKTWFQPDYIFECTEGKKTPRCMGGVVSPPTEIGEQHNRYSEPFVEIESLCNPIQARIFASRQKKTVFCLDLQKHYLALSV